MIETDKQSIEAVIGSKKDIFFKNSGLYDKMLLFYQLYLYTICS